MVVACDTVILLGVTVPVLIAVISVAAAIVPTTTLGEPVVCWTSSDPVIFCRQTTKVCSQGDEVPEDKACKVWVNVTVLSSAVIEAPFELKSTVEQLSAKYTFSFVPPAVPVSPKSCATPTIA
jgi:hypothetical protein